MNRISLLVAMMAVLSGCQSMGPSSPGDVNDRSGLYNGSRSVLYKVQKDISSPEQVMLIAETAYRAGDLDQALYQYLRAIELDPKRYEALVWVGRIHRERGNQQLAEMAFADVLNSDPDNPDALAEMGLLNLTMRRHDLAVEMLGKAVGLDQKRLGGTAADASTVDVASLKVDAQSPLKVYNGLGVLADLRNDFPKAEAYYRLAMQIEPRSALVQNSLGYSYYLAGRWEEAARAYQLGITYDSNYKPLWRNYGLLLARTGRYEEAISAFEQIENSAEASNDVGYISLIEGKLDVAEQFFRSAIEQSPAHYDVAWQNLNRVQQIRRIRELGGNPDSVAVAPLEEPVAQ
ncbi:MAG: tetratricopeptide repeat protein [Pseudomonas sp.]